MTIAQLYQLAQSLLPTNAGEDDSLRRYMTGWVNLALAETFDIENSIRREYGEAELLTPPMMTGEGDTLPYSDRISGYAFPYFIASLMAKDDEDIFWSETYRNRYVVALGELRKSAPESVKDIYRGCRDA